MPGRGSAAGGPSGCPTAALQPKSHGSHGRAVAGPLATARMAGFSATAAASQGLTISAAPDLPGPGGAGPDGEAESAGPEPA